MGNSAYGSNYGFSSVDSPRHGRRSHHPPPATRTVDARQAVRELESELHTNTQICGHLLAAFDAEVEPLKPYARSETLSRLWMDKINPRVDGSRGGGAGGERHENLFATIGNKLNRRFNDIHEAREGLLRIESRGRGGGGGGGGGDSSETNVEHWLKRISQTRGSLLSLIQPREMPQPQLTQVRLLVKEMDILLKTIESMADVWNDSDTAGEVGVVGPDGMEE
ncbi:MAG: hypothetical protein M1814_004587 [Vezdaea aestivalis]|nr:MAG: hypothetical protein M1814_004587 [Vezdaea aestivalis]